MSQFTTLGPESGILKMLVIFPEKKANFTRFVAHIPENSITRNPFLVRDFLDLFGGYF